MILFTNDIFRFVGDAILADGYTDIRDISVEIIEEKVNEFLRMKLNESDVSLDNTTLLMRLEMFLEGYHDKDKMMSNFTFYLLHFMSILQGYSIAWKIEDVDKPYLKDSEFTPGKIDSLVTNKDINYIDTFNFVLGEARKLEGRGR